MFVTVQPSQAVIQGMASDTTAESEPLISEARDFPTKWFLVERLYNKYLFHIHKYEENLAYDLQFL